MDSEQQYDVSESDSEYDSDDSQEDPTFDLMEETRSSLSKLSIRKQKPKDMSARRNVTKALDDCVEEEQELDEKDKKSYETVQKIIKGGQIEKLKVEQCKVYLRKHALRLTGSKDTLIQRIKEHTDILDGRGEEKYPPSSFVLNCKGDACSGDVIMFEQNVYEMFSIASRSATGPPCGTRIVAGRIVKESYGAKKQQHTFTVEVLWSKGEKPLPPLHPLLIKGRNLYRLKTLRQKWDNEAERLKILSEKHARGSVARSNRETRVQEKEMRKMRREFRVSTDFKEKKTVDESKGKRPHSHSMNSLNKKDDQPQVEVVDNGQNDERKEFRNYTNVIHENVFPGENRPDERPNQRQPLTNVNLNDPSSYRGQQGFGASMSPLRVHNPNLHLPMWRGSSYGGNTTSYNSPSRMPTSNVHNIPTWRGYNDGSYNSCNTIRSPMRGHDHVNTGGHVNLNDPSSYREQQGFGASKSPLRVYNSNSHLPMWRGSSYGGNTTSYNSPSRMPTSIVHNIPMRSGYNDGSYNNCNTIRSPMRGHGHVYTGGHGHSQNMNYKSPQRTESWQTRNGWCNEGVAKRPFLQGKHEEQKKPCRFYARGRCYYGHSCKYLHDSVDI